MENEERDWGDDSGPFYNGMHLPYHYPMQHASSKAIPSNTNTGGGVFSFSELLKDASAGVLEFDKQNSFYLYQCPQKACEPYAKHLNGEESAKGNEDMGNRDTNSTILKDPFLTDNHSLEDGYLGGHEWEERKETRVGSVSEDDNDAETDENNECHAFRMDSAIETTVWTDLDSDSEVLPERLNEEMSKGDGGCDGIHDVQDITSDSSDSDESLFEEDAPAVTDLSQEFYIDHEQWAAPYKKRKRVPKDDMCPNYRKPRLMGSCERAMRAAATRKTEFIFEPALGLVFDSRQEAREFYNLYSWEVGFGVKYCNSRTSGKKSENDELDREENEKYRSMQDIVCQQAGTGDRAKSSTKKCGCKAKIRLLRTEDHAWYISLIVKEHNHPLAVTCGERRELNSHKHIDPHTKDIIRYLRQNNVSLTKVHCILGSMYGSMGDVPWTKRSLRTVCNQISREQIDGDIRKTMEIFKQMHEADPGFRFSVELDKYSRVKTLIWCSGRGRDQYMCFGDVITFDTTYCTNIYKMPFGLFVGVNHHFQTTIFGAVLMRRGTTKSFKWVFREFISLMGGKAPQTIFTDQSQAMTRAISVVLPGTYHLWCKWHVMKRLRECLGPLYTKNKEFRDAFWLVVNGMLTEDEFEAGWADLLKRYKLEENSFMKRTYDCKKRWAKPWSKDKFCARMSSTQRSESANCMLKRFVPRNSSMNHFVSQYNRMLYDRDREEEIAEHKTKQLKMVHSRLWSIERHALEIYTKAAFELFRSEVDKASNYVLSERNGDTYTISHDNASNRAHWQRVHFKVDLIGDGERFVCECGLYEHFGMLCCHSIRLMLKLDITRIPSAHIMKRWTRDARDVLPPELKSYQKDQGALGSFTFRHKLLYVDALKLVDKGNMDMEMFGILRKHHFAADKEMDALLASRLKKAGQGVQPDESSDDEKKLTLGNRSVFSDSEIVNIRAPILHREAGRLRETRFHAGWEQNKWKKKKKTNKRNNVLSTEVSASLGAEGGEQNMVMLQEYGNLADEAGLTKKKGAKRVRKCGKCKLPGHTQRNCSSIEVNEFTAAAYFG